MRQTPSGKERLAMKKTVWVNLDPKQVDLTPLRAYCETAGHRFASEDVGTDPGRVLEMGKMADAIVSIGETWGEAELSQLTDRPRIIVRYGVGVDNVDIPAATRHKIPVANLPGLNSPAVAEVALLHILNLGRRFIYSVTGGKEGKWPCRVQGNELDGKTLGLIGFGNIPRQLVRMTQGFSRKVIAYDPWPNDAMRRFADEYGVELTDSPAPVWSTADFVCVNVHYTNQTHEFVNMDCFKLMKPTAYFINTCRGGVVREEDLIEALQKGIIRGAGLDVMREEPPAPDNPLLHMDNVFVSTHLGAVAVETEERSQQVIAQIIDAFFAGAAHPNILNPEVMR